MATNKQKAALAKILENPSKPVSVIMEEVGYEPNTAKTPNKNLLQTQGFIQLLEEHGLDDDSLARRHKELLHTDDNIAIKALDMAYKVKSHYAPEKSVQVQVKGEVKDFAKYQALKEKYEQELLSTIAEDFTH